MYQKIELEYPHTSLRSHASCQTSSVVAIREHPAPTVSYKCTLTRLPAKSVCQIRCTRHARLNRQQFSQHGAGCCATVTLSGSSLHFLGPCRPAGRSANILHTVSSFQGALSQPAQTCSDKALALRPSCYGAFCTCATAPRHARPTASAAHGPRFHFEAKHAPRLQSQLFICKPPAKPCSSPCVAQQRHEYLQPRLPSHCHARHTRCTGRPHGTNIVSLCIS